MNDLLDPSAVEARLRRTLAARAEDMAAADGEPWDPTARVAAPALDPAPAPARRSRRLLAMAAAAAAVAATVAAVQLTGGDDGTTRAVTPAQEGPAPSPPPTDAGVPDWHGRGPALVAGYERAGVPPDQYHWLWMTWYPDPAMASQPPPWPHEDLSVDGRPARLEWYTNEVLVQDVLVFYDDGVLGLTSGDLTRDEVLAMAATIHRDSDTIAFAATPPADWVFTESRPGAVFTHDDALAAEAARLKDELGSWLDATTTVPAG